VGNHSYLSRCVQVADATWRAATRIYAGVGDLMLRTVDGQAQVGYSMPGRSRGRMTPCVIYIMHMEMRCASFLVESQNQGRRFVSDLTSKLLGRFLPV
jgi:hypothetical protein